MLVSARVHVREQARQQGQKHCCFCRLVQQLWARALVLARVRGKAQVGMHPHVQARQQGQEYCCVCDLAKHLGW